LSPWIEALGIIKCGLIVAAGVVPLMAGCTWLNRRLGEPVVPPLKPWPVPWSGWDVTILIFIVMFVIPPFVSASLEAMKTTPDENAGLFRRLSAALLALPLQLGVVWLLRTSLHPAWRPITLTRQALPARLVLACRAWLAITPVVFLVHFAVNLCMSWLGSAPEEHPLVKSFRHLAENEQVGEQMLLVAQVCVAAPLVEELLCRGILLPWTARKLGRSGLIIAISIAIALFLFVMKGTQDHALLNGLSLAVFASVLTGIWLLWLRRERGKRDLVAVRRQGAIYASSLFFAALHVQVWPTPVPLFVLGLGLGWLAFRTRGIFVSVVVHGLFNSVSLIYMLRSAA
jgi:membrane protease YdiL (CAAX protease family)